MTYQPPRRDRAQVRNAVVAALQAGLPLLAGRIYRSRQWPISQAFGPTLTEFPAALVYASPETKTREHARASVDKQYRVECDVTIVVRDIPLPGTAPVEERLEARLEEHAGTVEAIILTTPELVGGEGAVEDVTSVRTDMAMDNETGTLLGAVAMTFTLEWTEAWSVPLPPCCEDPEILLAAIPRPPDALADDMGEILTDDDGMVLTE